ncbi:unnamed protein product [Closterium sp. NIES-53]
MIEMTHDVEEELFLPLSCLFQLHNLTLESPGKLQRLPNNLGLALHELRELNITHARELVELPATVVELHKLTRLEIQHAPTFSSLPENLGALSRLRDVWLTFCPSLNYLPDSFTRLSCIFLLQLESSAIRPLSPGFAQLTTLRQLNLSGCVQLQALP